jgi:hypothetical protein
MLSNDIEMADNQQRKEDEDAKEGMLLCLLGISIFSVIFYLLYVFPV